jgi:hypothetical protein
MPANDYAFKEIATKWPEFIDEPHNVRLSLGTDIFHLKRFQCHGIRL